MIRIALTKGRIEEKTVDILEKAGYSCGDLRNKGRRLVFQIGDGTEVVLSKSADVITYIEHGVCDVGIVGEDTIMEHGKTFYELLDLGFGRCRFALAGLKGKDFYGGYSHKIIATKYPNVAKNYFNSKGLDVEIVKIEGSVELAPILGLADAIVDIVETGSTLRENGLEVLEEILPLSARVVVNRVSMKMEQERITGLINDMRRIISEVK